MLENAGWVVQDYSTANLGATRGVGRCLRRPSLDRGWVDGLVSIGWIMQHQPRSSSWWT